MMGELSKWRPLRAGVLAEVFDVTASQFEGLRVYQGEPRLSTSLVPEASRCSFGFVATERSAQGEPTRLAV